MDEKDGKEIGRMIWTDEKDGKEIGRMGKTERR
jgi:hypothetical protein